MNKLTKRDILFFLLVVFTTFIIAVNTSCNEYAAQRTNNRAIESFKFVFPNAECSSWSISNNDFMPDVAICKAPTGASYCRAGAWTSPQCTEFARFAPAPQAAQPPAQK